MASQRQEGWPFTQTSPTKRDLRFGWKWAISGLGQGSTSKIQKHLVTSENRKRLMGTWLKDTGTDLKRVPLATFGLIWASERIMMGMSHREPFFFFFWRGPEWVSRDSKEMREPVPSCCGLNPKCPHKLCTRTSAIARGFLWEGDRIQSRLSVRLADTGHKGWAWKLIPSSKLWTETVSCSGYCAWKEPHEEPHAPTDRWSCSPRPPPPIMVDRVQGTVSWNKSFLSYVQDLSSILSL